MSQVAIIIDDVPSNQPTEFATQNPFFLLLDATTSEVHKRKSNIANHPLEGGGQITDHAETKLEKISIQGVISNHSPNRQFPGDGSRIRLVRDFFERAKERRLRLRTLKYGVIQPVLMESWPQKINAPLDSVEVNLTFQKMEFAEWDETELPPDQVQQEQMAAKCTCGPQPTKGNESNDSTQSAIEQINKATPLNFGPEDSTLFDTFVPSEIQQIQ